MKSFTEAYVKLREVLDFQRFQPAWQKFLTTDVNVKALLGHDGPSAGHGSGLDLLRVRINKEDRRRRATALLEACKLDMIRLASGVRSAEVPAFAMFDAAPAMTEEPLFNGGGSGDAIVAKENGSGLGTVGERAAALKMLAHLYRTQKRGGQDVWVYAPPMAYSRWVFEEISGPDEHIRGRLDQDDECYSAADRATMCAALAQALKWSMDAVAKLGSPTPSTKALVRTWFADQATTEVQLTDAITKLLFGFKKIAAVCNSNVLIFSDEPMDRNSLVNPVTEEHGWDAFAFVRTNERMNVVYLQKAFLKAGATGKISKCALTIVHEISHREARTRDKMYDFQGLKPDTKRFPSKDAIINADSWAYFATDLAGMLGPTEKAKAQAGGKQDDD